MSTKTQRATNRFIMRTYVYKLETLEEVKPSVTKGNTAQADVEWVLTPGKYLLVTVAPSRYGYGVSVFKVEVGASVVVRKVGITFIKRLDELRGKITELVAGKPKKAESDKKPKPGVDEVGDVDVDEGGEE